MLEYILQTLIPGAFRFGFQVIEIFLMSTSTIVMMVCFYSMVIAFCVVWGWRDQPFRLCLDDPKYGPYVISGFLCWWGVLYFLVDSLSKHSK